MPEVHDTRDVTKGSSPHTSDELLDAWYKSVRNQNNINYLASFYLYILPVISEACKIQNAVYRYNNRILTIFIRQTDHLFRFFIYNSNPRQTLFIIAPDNSCHT